MTFYVLAADRVVGLAPDPSPVLIGLNVAASACPLALCASSATIGHSLSFGQGGLCAALPDGALADALATALCNLCKAPATSKAVVGWRPALREAWAHRDFRPVRGAIGVWGDMGADGGGARF